MINLSTWVFPSPSKIPYGGFSPVRLQTGIQPPPSAWPPNLSAARVHPAARSYRRLQPKHPGCAAHRRANRSGIGRPIQSAHAPVAQVIPSRGPWLPSGLCCPPDHRLLWPHPSLSLSSPHLCIRGGAPPTHGPASGGEREVPQFTPCFCAFVPSSVPRWTGWMLLAVLHHPHWPSPFMQWLGVHKSHTRRFWCGQSNEAARFDFFTTARRLARPSPTRAFTVELSPVRSP